MRPRSSTHPRARKRFGQHFLAPAWAVKLVAAIAPQPGDVFLEIGPGTGALTIPLASTGARILAVEIDRNLVPPLASRVPGNVTLLSGDILQVDVMALLRGLEPQRPLDAARREGVEIVGSPGLKTGRSTRFRVVGNLPYNVASPILFRLLDLHRRHEFFADATVMLQKEVADRLLARAGTKDYGVLTILTRLHASTTRLLELPPGAFTPRPKVRSTVVRLTFTPRAVAVADEAMFERVTKGLFMYRRKTLANALKRFSPAGQAALEHSGLDGRRRPETLTLLEIARLADLLAGVPVL